MEPSLQTTRWSDITVAHRGAQTRSQRCCIESVCLQSYAHPSDSAAKTQQVVDSLIQIEIYFTQALFDAFLPDITRDVTDGVSLRTAIRASNLSM